jgi:molybdate transport system substrate-binding protein
MKSWLSLAMGAALIGSLGWSGTAPAGEITVLASSGSNGIVRILAAEFEKKTGNKVIVTSEPSQTMTQKIEANAPGDLLAQASDQFDDLVKRGKVVAGTVKDYARAGNGVAVKAGAPKPDISTPDAFKRAMLNAKSIGHTNNGTGPYNTKLFQRLGIYDQIKDKIKIIDGRPVGAAVAAGDVEIGIQQASVIKAAPGTDFLGALPAELTEFSQYGIGVLTVAKDAETARKFISFVTSPDVAPIIRNAAMDLPAK